MSYLSLYRKYRSQTFGELIGQDHVVKTLQNALSSGKIAHAYLFTGPRGTGKTSTARLLAKALCCEKGPTPTPCNECHICTAITEGSCMDVYEIDAASESSVENVREAIVEAVEYQPSVCRFKIFIIDEVHDLSPKAFDALLKTIEEPPEHVIFILATTEYHKVPPTIRSRCQKYEFHRASIQDLLRSLDMVVKLENASADPAALALIARMADGGYRDALTLLEQALISGEGPITVQQIYDQLGLISDEIADNLLLAIRSGNVESLLSLLAQVIQLGRDPRSIVESMLYRVADLTRASYGLETGDDSARKAALHATAASLGRDQLLALRSQLAEIHLAVRDITLPRIWLESRLIGLATSGLRSATLATASALTMETARPVVAKSAAPAREAAPATNGAAPETQEVPPTAEVVHLVETGNPTLDRANQLLQQVLASLPLRDGGPTTAAVHLRKMRVIDLDDDFLTLEADGNTCEWFQIKGERKSFVEKHLTAAAGKTMMVKFQIAKPKATGIVVETVEQPLEGDALYQAAQKQNF